MIINAFYIYLQQRPPTCNVFPFLGPICSCQRVFLDPQAGDCAAAQVAVNSKNGRGSEALLKACALLVPASRACWDLRT